MATAETAAALVRNAASLLERAVKVIAESSKDRIRSQELLEEVRGRFVEREALIDQSRTLRATIREAVSALAVQQRRAGEPPEQMVKLLKKLLIDAHVEELDSDIARSFLDDVVHWGIEAYYAA